MDNSICRHADMLQDKTNLILTLGTVKKLILIPWIEMDHRQVLACILLFLVFQKHHLAPIDYYLQLCRACSYEAMKP